MYSFFVKDYTLYDFCVCNSAALFLLDLDVV
jgi:hypothetical protein